VRFRPAGRAAALVAVTAAILVPLGVLGAPALARSASSASEYQYSGSSQYRVAVCHRTGSKQHPWHVITVAAPAVKAHLKHGDKLAPCPTTSSPAQQHGHAGDDQDQGDADASDHGGSASHGESGDHGNSHGHGT
jgi:hypothetical protein